MENLGIHTEPSRLQMLSKPLVFDLGEYSTITIDTFQNSTGEFVFRVKCVDNVVNEWNEYFATLSLALARVAVLTGILETESYDTGNQVLFKDSPDVFADKAYRFISDSVSGF